MLDLGLLQKNVRFLFQTSMCWQLQAFEQDGTRADNVILNGTTTTNNHRAICPIVPTSMSNVKSVVVKHHLYF